MREAWAKEAAEGGLPLVWLQAQSCSGCSVSLLNSIASMSIDDLLVNSLDLEFHSSLMAAPGNLAVSAAEKAYRRGDYVLVVEGAIPTAADGTYCYLWPGLTALKGVDRYAKRARHILAVGACACYGGMVGGAPNPTGAQGLEAEYYGKQVIKIPGCPTHPDWIVNTVARVMNEDLPTLDSYGRPSDFFRNRIHPRCQYFEGWEEVDNLNEVGCLRRLGCKGPDTRADCPTRKWNAAGSGQTGINWCVGAGSPCYGCTEPTFPDGMAPFFDLERGNP
jgi:hydrogenase small subunit